MVASMSFNPSFVSILLCSMLDPDGHPAYSTPKLFLLVHNIHIEKSETSWSYAVEMCGLVMWRKCSKLLVHVWALHFMHFFISDIFGFNGTSYFHDKSCHSAAVLATPLRQLFWGHQDQLTI